MVVYFLAAAEFELKETVEWYDVQFKGLGDRFGSAVKETVNRIQIYPEASTIDRDGFRRIFIKGFPYKIIYYIDNGEIWIVAIAHGHRMPGYWKDRI